MTSSNGLNKYDTVVKDKYGKDAFLVDMKGQDGNVSGKFDKNDYVVYKENGETKMKPVGQDDMYDMQYRQSVVDAATTMDKRLKDGSVGFQGSMENQKYNTNFWQQTDVDGKKMWRVKEGVNPADAINDVFNKQTGKKYDLDCAASANLVAMKAKLDTIGADDFNKQYDKMHIRGWSTWNADQNGQVGWDNNGALSNVNGERSGKGKVSDFKVGDFVYFTNRNAAENSGPAQGENAYYIGKDTSGKPMYFGNPIGIIHSDHCAFGDLSTIKGTMDPRVLAQEDRTKQAGY
jgi:protein-glutamine gamma-glutamyltransferase